MSKDKVVNLKDKKPVNEEGENVGAVAQTSQQSTAVAAVPEMDFFSDAGKGLEGTDKDSFAIPFLQVLQGLSPQLETVEGARPGMLINTVSNRLMTEARVIPVAFKRRFLRWVPRAAGGGFKGEMMPSEVDALVASKAARPAIGDDGKERNFFIYEGDELKDTRIHFVLLENDGMWSWAIMSMGSTQIKKSKRWIAAINELRLQGPNGVPFNPPSFSHIYKVSVVKEENAKGKWHSFDIKLEGPVTDPNAYKMAKDYHAQIQAGTVTVQHQQDAEPEDVGDGEKF